MEKRPVGLDGIKLDLLFILTASIKVEKSFTYEQQRNYYLKNLFPTISEQDMRDIIEFGEQNKRFSEYMFPNSPAKVRNKKFIADILAECTLLNQIYIAENFLALNDEAKIKASCFNSFKITDPDAENAFAQEIKRRYTRYLRDFSEKDFESFKTLMEKFSVPFAKIFDSIKGVLTTQEVKSPDAFSILCKKLKVPSDKEVLFKLKLDALAEIQIGNNAHVEYFDNLREDWREKFPEYKYCDEAENYIREEKRACIVAFGNRLTTMRNEILLFELLTAIKIKLALLEGALNPDALQAALTQKIEKLPQDELRKKLDEQRKKITEYYALNLPESYDANIKNELVAYKASLLYADEILTEEILLRYKSSANQIRPVADRDAEKKYELLLSQKDAEIYRLNREIEYYENIKSQEFRNDFSKYDEAFAKLFQRLCEYKSGAPLNELYLMAQSETDIKIDDLKTVMKNFLYVFTAFGISPYETKNLGKKMRFDSEDANVVYAVNEKDVVDGINVGTLKYPGWKHGEKKVVLPFITVDKEEN